MQIPLGAGSQNIEWRNWEIALGRRQLRLHFEMHTMPLWDLSKQNVTKESIFCTGYDGGRNVKRTSLKHIGPSIMPWRPTFPNQLTRVFREEKSFQRRGNSTITSSVNKNKPKKRPVSMFDDTDEYSSSSSDNSTTKDSRPRVFRKKKSAVFQKSLDEAKRCKHEIAVKKTLISNVDERRYAISSCSGAPCFNRIET